MIRKFGVLFLFIGILNQVFSQQWNDVGGGVNGFIYIMKSDTILNRLYVGGDFTQAGNIPANNIAYWDGSTWHAVGQSTVFKGVITTVEAITIYNGDLIIGGRFDSIDNTAMNNIALWNGSSWTNLGMGLQPSGSVVKSLEIYNGELYAAGDFFNSGNDTLRYIAKWNGTSWEKLIRGLDTYSNSLIVYNNHLIVSGPFVQTFTSDSTTILCSNTISWNGAIWESFGCNLVDDGLGFEIFNDTLYSCGESGLNFFDGIVWQSLPSPSGGPQPWVVGLQKYKNYLYVCGYFTQPPKMARFNGVGYDSICDMNGIVEELEVFQNELYAGGAFNSINGITINNIVRYTDGTYILNFEPENFISVYPNPSIASDGQFIQIKSNIKTNKATLKITDTLGREIFSDEILISEDTIYKLPQLIPGLYFVVLSTEDYSYSEKIIMQ